MSKTALLTSPRFSWIFPVFQCLLKTCRYLTERYDQLMQSWVKRVERLENNAKRRAKDTKTREFFEKVFPELKKQREDKERIQRY